MAFSVDRTKHGKFANAILEDGKVVLHLQEGTTRNEENIDRIVAILNNEKSKD